MRRFTKPILIAALAGTALSISVAAYADSGVVGESYPQFTSRVGSVIYAEGPLKPMKEFKLQMKMAHPAMNTIKEDYSKGKKLSCTMVPAGTNNDMAILDCKPTP